MAQVFLVSRVLTFQSGQVTAAPVGVFRDKADAEKHCAQGMAELQAVSGAKLVRLGPTGRPQQLGDGALAMTMLGVDSVHFDIADVDVKDSSLVLPATPQLIVPGRG